MPEVVYKIKTEGAEDVEKKTKSLGDAFKSVSRDIDAVAGEAGAKFGKFASDVWGVAEALGEGGVMGAAAGITGVLGLGVLAWDKWKEHATRAAREAESASKAVSDDLKELQGLAKQAADYAKGEHRSSSELQDVAAENKALLELIGTRKDATAAEIDRRQRELSSLSMWLVGTEKERDLRDQIASSQRKMTEYTAAESGARRAITESEGNAKVAAEREANKKIEEERKKALDAFKQHMIAMRAAQYRTLQDSIDPKAGFSESGTEFTGIGGLLTSMASARNADTEATKRWKAERIGIAANIDQENEAWGRVVDIQNEYRAAVENGQLEESKRGGNMRAEIDLDISRIKQRSAAYQASVKDELAAGKLQKSQADALIATDNQIRDARIANREAEAKATQIATQTTMAATYAELAKSAAMMVAQPVLNEVLASERELLMLNRETFKDYKEQDWAAIIAQKTQAILTGIAVEATGRAVMEGGEALASLAAGLAFLAVPGGQASATAMFGSAAQHAAAATVFAGIAGVSAVGAVGVGSQRGEGGLVGLTAAEKKTTNPFNNDSGSRSGRTTSSSNMASGGGGPTVQYTTYYYGAGAVDASEKDQRNRTVQAANRDNALNPFAQREAMRAP